MGRQVEFFSRLHLLIYNKLLDDKPEGSVLQADLTEMIVSTLVSCRKLDWVNLMTLVPSVLKKILRFMKGGYINYINTLLLGLKYICKSNVNYFVIMLGF